MRNRYLRDDARSRAFFTSVFFGRRHFETIVVVILEERTEKKKQATFTEIYNKNDELIVFLKLFFNLLSCNKMNATHGKYKRKFA